MGGRKRSQEKLERAIENMLTEQLDCFVLVGYDVDGNEVTCRVIESDKDRDSLLVSINNLADRLNDAYYGNDDGGQDGECEEA